jgi:integrase
MGAADRYVHKRLRGGREVWQIDFVYDGPDGRKLRFMRAAMIQTRAAACSEAEERYISAKTLGDPRLVRERAAAEAEAAIANAPPPPVTVAEFVAGDFAKVWMPKFARSTRIRYQALLDREILPRFGPMAIAAIDPKAAREWAVDLGKRVNARHPLNMLRTILRAAMDSGIITAIPTPWPTGKRSKKLPEAPSDEEVAAMLEHATGWLRTSIMLAAFAGLRMGEVRGLEVRDLSFDESRIHVRHSMSEDEPSTTKSGHDRMVPMIPELRAELLQACKSKLPRARVVLSSTGITQSRQAFLAEYQGLLRRRGLRHRSFHALRHYFCSAMIRRGASIEAVRVLAGHSSLQVTERYAHATAADLAVAMTRLRPGA